MDSDRAVLASFIGVLALIVYRDFKQPDSSWPLGPVPPPYRFTYAGVVFGLLFLLADLWSPRVAGVIGIGVLIGTAFSVTSGQSSVGGLKSNAPTYSKGGGKTASANPSVSSGSTSVVQA